ncbi:MAG: UDPglucose--hexose-phosphate uridylyltransferase [Solirubrobacteraceae bacterium]|nr:UDPglucose--hexose-phosphate uridylyltransferase [Solirubrobacteraceae bacterium]
MPEVRVDPLSGRRTIIATDRADRPGAEFQTAPVDAIDPSSDPFAEGNEALTPPELYAVRPGGGPADGPGWRVRVVPNRYPALERASPTPEPDATPDLFTAVAATGSHEVIVNAPASVGSLAELDADQVAVALDAWRERILHHHRAACVHLIVNEGHEAGASLLHTHAQLFALDFVPAQIARERERAGAYATRTMGQSLLADLLQEEVRRRERIVAIDDEAVLIAPYASQLPYQLMLVPRKPRPRFEADGPTGAGLLHDGLRRLSRLFGGSPPLNLWIRTAPRGSDHFCWRIDILPRLAGVAGLELGAGVGLNPVAPERAAAALRDA